MRNPNSPQPPRLTTAPIPLPDNQWQGIGGYAAVYDLDRVDEVVFQQDRLLTPFRIPDDATLTQRGELIRQQHMTLAAFCCVGLVSADGTPCGGELDNPAAWADWPLPVLRWLTGPGLRAAQGILEEGFLATAAMSSP